MSRKVFTDSKTAHPSNEWIRKGLLSIVLTLSVAIVIALITGCSVYESNGRKMFESRAPGNIYKSENAATQESAESEEKQEATTAESNETCWIQPAQDPLWDLPQNQKLRVHPINPELIEVCLVANN